MFKSCVICGNTLLVKELEFIERKTKQAIKLPVCSVCRKKFGYKIKTEEEHLLQFGK